jgi:Tfp pilus assembly protein PilO
MKNRMIEQFADSPQRVRIMFRVAMIALLAAAGYNWMVRPQASYLSAAQQQNRWGTALSDQQRHILVSIGELKKKLSEMESRSEQFQKVLFEPQTVRDFFCGLETQASAAGCRIESLTFSDTDNLTSQKQSPGAMVQTVAASVIVVGNYNALASFFEQVGRCSQKISIYEMRIEPVTPGKPMLRCDVTLMVYMLNKNATQNPKNTNNPEKIP